jgi:hypothetical protein
MPQHAPAAGRRSRALFYGVVPPSTQILEKHTRAHTRTHTHTLKKTNNDAEIVIEWNNPTTEKTGCPAQFRVETTSSKAWQTIDNPIQSPVSYKFLLNANQKVDVKVAAYNKQADKYSSYTSLSGGVTGVSGPTGGVSPGGPIKLCTQGIVPPTPTSFRVKSNVYNPSTKRSEVLLEWKTTTDPNAGCIKQFDVQSYVSNGGMKDSTPAAAGQTTYTKLRLLNPGQQAKFEVWSVGSDGAKMSGKAVISSVTGAGGTATATPYGRKMML